jgi:hypothetical protein
MACTSARVFFFPEQGVSEVGFGYLSQGFWNMRVHNVRFARGAQVESGGDRQDCREE